MTFVVENHRDAGGGLRLIPKEGERDESAPWCEREYEEAKANLSVWIEGMLHAVHAAAAPHNDSDPAAMSGSVRVDARVGLEGWVSSCQGDAHRPLRAIVADREMKARDSVRAFFKSSFDIDPFLPFQAVVQGQGDSMQMVNFTDVTAIDSVGDAVLLIGQITSIEMQAKQLLLSSRQGKAVDVPALFIARFSRDSIIAVAQAE